MKLEINAELQYMYVHVVATSMMIETDGLKPLKSGPTVIDGSHDLEDVLR